MKLSLSNSIIEYMPKLSVKNQKLLFLIFGSIKKDIFKSAQINNTSVLCKISKKEIFSIFGNKDFSKARRDFYSSKKELHEIMKISTEDGYIETSIISATRERKRIDEIIFEIPNVLIDWQVDYKDGNFLNAETVEMGKLKKRHSIYMYAFFRKEMFKGKILISPDEFNAVFKTKIPAGNILILLKDIRDDFSSKEINIDFSIEVIKEGRKIINFQINFINKNTTIEEYSYNLINQSKEIHKSIINYKGDKKFIFCISALKNLSELQIDYIYNLYLGLDKDNIKRKIIDKIIANTTASETQNKSFKIHIISWINSFTPSEINKKLELAIYDIVNNTGKIKNKTGIIIHKINQLGEDQKKLKVLD